MKNVLRVFRRDVVRLFKAPAALVVVLFLIALPSLYTWFNVVGFWNPYDNTGNLRVCVVNEDAGATSDLMGELHLGDQIVDELHSNTQLGWKFTDRETAMQEVQSGRAYAAFVIPSDFSEDFTTLLTGDFQQPQLLYYVNEKTGAVSPKITDTGATTLDETINSTFVSTASEVAASTVEAKISESEGKISASQTDVVQQMIKAKASIAEARQSVSGLADATNTAIGKTNDAKANLQQEKATISLLSSQLKQVSQLTAATESDLSVYSASLMTTMDQSSIMVSQAAAKTNTAIGTAAGRVTEAQAEVDAAIATGQAAVKQNEATIAQMQALYDSMPDGDSKTALGQAIAVVTSENATLEQSLADLQVTSADTKAAADSITAASSSVNTAVQGTISSADAYRSMLSSTTLPAVYGGLAQLSSTSASLSAAVANQVLLVDQASLTLDQLASTLQTTSSALGQTDTLLGNLESSLDAAQTDIAALSLSDTLSSLLGGGSIDAGKIADFMLSPTELHTESLYPLNAYGSAMAPLFTNLTLWIGVFMLMVILKQEVDDEGIKNLTISQRYLGRWLFLAPIAMLQAIVCCVGNLVIGVQTVNVALYFLTAIVASLTYLSIQYALSVTLQYIGKGLCVVLVFVQIPGATGLYPTEMTPSFFQAVYPFFPFTYGINAMRETIGGFYDGQWGHLMFVLLLFLGISFVLGLLIRPYLTNLNRMFAQQIKESTILNGEDVQVPARRYRLGQIIQVLSDREEYRTRLRNSARRFIMWYPRLKRGAWIFGIIVPTVGTLALSLTGSQKVYVLTAWLVWLIAVIMFLVIVEHIRDSLNRQIVLEDMRDEDLRSLFSIRTSLDGDSASGAEEPQGGREV